MADAGFDRELDCLAAPGQGAVELVSVRPDGLQAALGKLDPAAASYAGASGFKAEAGQLLLLPGGTGLGGALLGLGADRSPWAHGGLPMALPEGTAWRLAPGDFDMGGAVLGFCCGAYQFTCLSKPKRLAALLSGAEPHAVSLALARSVWLARDLINTPANLLGPAELAEAAIALGQRFGADCCRAGGAALETEYPTVAAVGRGSERAPVVAGFDWFGSGAGAQAKHIWLCGKGVCFDTGGYDLKPPSGMLRMKKDMGGAAIMLALASAIMQRDLPVRLSVRIGCVENMVSGGAMRPLDVLRTRRGLTVEVGNTDAEGRLVLCDLLAEASDQHPDLLLDASTLTGAARVALGPDLPALFTPQDMLAEGLLQAGLAVDDPLWRLPLFAGYDAWLTSPVADLNNVSSKPQAGAIIAALFLQRFVASSIMWGHLDVYAWNDSSRPGRPEGGEAGGLRALFAFVETLTSV